MFMFFLLVMIKNKIDGELNDIERDWENVVVVG